MSDQIEFSFEIDAGVVFRLGEELITDEVQALFELVKNSYDADASWAKVRVDTEATESENSRLSGFKGLIEIEDDGDGMDVDSIQKGWLTIASSPKRIAKEKGEKTRKGRTPLGDKGLGRLGAQRLAKTVELVTRPREGQLEYYVVFSWKEFEDADRLGEVRPSIVSRRRTKKSPGTTLILSDLKDPGAWAGERRARALQRKLSSLVSPFRRVRGFSVYVDLDGKKIELAEVAEAVRDSALLRYVLEFDGSCFDVLGKIRLEYLEPSKKEDKLLFQAATKSDRGRGLFAFLNDKGGGNRLPMLRRSKSKTWFLEFGYSKELADLDGVELAEAKVANPGAFSGEIDAVSLDRADSKSGVFDRPSEYKKLVANLAGIRVYRDGFGIRVGEDWLGLGKQWTSAKSYYTLRPGNVLGFINLSGEENPQLQETTNREGFQVTPHYENFLALLKDFVKFSGHAQSLLRRGTLAYLRSLQEQESGIEEGQESAEITREIGQVADDLASGQEMLDAAAQDLGTAADRASAQKEKATGELEGLDELDSRARSAVERLDTTVSELEAVVRAAQSTIASVTGDLARIKDLQALSASLDRRWELLRDELEEVYESVSLGITAEALSHEIHNIADSLARRGSSLSRALSRGDVRRAQIVAFVEAVHSSVVGMRKQLAHLTPSLRYLREKKEIISVGSFVTDLADFFADRLAGRKIRLAVQIEDDFHVQMNKGKLVQIFDNLILNSQYWLEEALRTKTLDAGLVEILIDAPQVEVSDNGPGVDRDFERTLFDPFVTAKRKGVGRGLGLFVVRQLLDSEGCAIVLLPDRNKRKRRYKFALDLSGAVVG